MLDEANRIHALAQIKSNIDRFGHHVYVVSGGKVPRFVYTIGLSKRLGAELMLCGASFYSAKQASELINALAIGLRENQGAEASAIQLENFGSFSLRQVDPSWSSYLLLGAFDYYRDPDIRARQLVPDPEHSTLDIPDASREWRPSSDPVWRSLDGRWDYPFSSNAVAVTNLAALRGECITEVARWEVNQWELFAGAGPDVQRHEMRVVPLSTMIGIDPTLMPATELDVGAALWRESISGSWREWRSKM